MIQKPAPQAPSGPTPGPGRSLLRSTLAALLVGLVLLLAWAYGWAGSAGSLATALHQLARWLPEGQKLEAQEVRGSLRHGGQIASLRWHDAHWQLDAQGLQLSWPEGSWLAPLLRGQVRLHSLRAARIRLQALAPDLTPTQPPSSIELPLQLDLPFQVDELLWQGSQDAAPLSARALHGRYRYDGTQHHVQLDGLDFAQGHYQAQASVQAQAPMALQLSVQGQLPSPGGGGHSLHARAQAEGSLAGTAAQLALQATLQTPAPEAGAAVPAQAHIKARIAPWSAQPWLEASAHLHQLDLAPLWPDSPRTRISGELALSPADGPAPAGWIAQAKLSNADAGPWDQARLPVQTLQVRAVGEGAGWRVEQAQLQAGEGHINASGQWQPGPTGWQLQAQLQSVRPGLLHRALEGPALSGSVQVQQAPAPELGAMDFKADLAADSNASPPALRGLRLQRAQVQGRWRAQQIELQQLNLKAERAQVQGRLQWDWAALTGNAQLHADLPGTTARLDGNLAPATGGGTLTLQASDLAALQGWAGALPGVRAALSPAGLDRSTLAGRAELKAQWQGGWQALQQQLEKPGASTPGSQALRFSARLDIPQLSLRPKSSTTAKAAATELRSVIATLEGSPAQARLDLRGQASLGAQEFQWETQAQLGLQAEQHWRVALATLRAQWRPAGTAGTASASPWRLELVREFDTHVRTKGRALSVQASTGALRLQGPLPGTALLEWEGLRLQRNPTGPAADPSYQLQSTGRLRGLPAAWSQALGRDASLSELSLGGDLVLDGAWAIDATERLRAHVELHRASGDLRIQAGESALVRRIESRGSGAASEISTDAQELSAATPAGLRRAELRLDADGDALRAQLQWDSERAGQLEAEASTRLTARAGGWVWPAEAPLSGRVRARLPQLGLWSILAPPGWRLAGTLQADATLSGQRAAPQWSGSLSAEQLAVRARVQGIDLRDGRLRATLAGQRLVLDEFVLNGGPGSRVRIPGRGGNLSSASSESSKDGGSLSFQGQLDWSAPPSAEGSGLQLDLRGKLQRLRALVRSDAQLTVSGDMQASLIKGRVAVRGQVVADRAVIRFPDASAPTLGEDVVVHSAARTRAQREAAQRNAQLQAAVASAASAAHGDVQQAVLPVLAAPPDIQLQFDLGRDFAVQGRGITTRLEGQLELRATSLALAPRVSGEIRSVQGQYRAYGQALDVETGIVRFSGTLDNPALDVLALRPNISHRAGVHISGNALSPQIKLYSDPTLSDAETLSWVMLGRASAGSGSEAILMQQAAMALLGRLGQGSSSGGLVNRLGLDELGLKGPGQGGELLDSTVTLGKRLSSEVYVTYEHSLGGALGTLYIFYELGRNLTLRGQAGQRNGVDLIYTVRYD